MFSNGASKIFVKLNRDIKFDRIALLRCNNHNITRFFPKKAPSILPPPETEIRNCINLDDTLQSMLKSEKLEFFPINEQQKYIRCSIVAQIKSFLQRFKYNNKILIQTVFIFDYLIGKLGNRMSYEKIGLGALLLGIKFNCVENMMIPMKKLYTAYSDVNPEIGQISFKELQNIEIVCIKHINYYLTFMSPLNFVEILLVKGIVLDNDILREGNNVATSVYSLPMTILEKVIQESHDYTLYHPYHVACACVALSREIRNLEKWPMVFSKTYYLKFEEFSKCFALTKVAFSTPLQTPTPKKMKNNSQSPVKRTLLSAEKEELLIKETLKFDVAEVVKSNERGILYRKGYDNEKRTSSQGRINNICVNESKFNLNINHLGNKSSIMAKGGYNGIFRNNLHCKTKSMDMASVDSFSNNTLASTFDNLNTNISNGSYLNMETNTQRKPNYRLGSIIKGINRSKVINLYQKETQKDRDYNITNVNFAKGKERESNSIGKLGYKNKNPLNISLSNLQNIYLNRKITNLKKEKNLSNTMANNE